MSADDREQPEEPQLLEVVTADEERGARRPSRVDRGLVTRMVTRWMR